MIQPQPTPWLVEFLKTFEQFRPTAYAATGDERRRGIWTIGFGHTRGVKEGDTCTHDQAQMWLQQDYKFAYSELCKNLTRVATPSQIDALTSLGFNCGVGAHGGAMDIADSTLLKKFNAGDIAGVAAEFVKWNKQRGRVLDGLTTRRKAEAAHFLT